MSYMTSMTSYFPYMASIKKTYSMKDVIERLNREADDEVGDSGDDIGC